MAQGSNHFKLLIIGGSAGSLPMVLKLLPCIKRESGLAIIMIFHRKHSEDNTLIEVLSRRTDFVIKDAEDKDEILPATIYLAPSDYHLLVEKNKTITLDDSEKINHCRPSIDVTFESAAEAYGTSLACLLLSGANADGVQGLKKAKQKGSLILVQEPSTAEVPYMPQQAVDGVRFDYLINENNFAECPLFLQIG